MSKYGINMNWTPLGPLTSTHDYNYNVPDSYTMQNLRQIQIKEFENFLSKIGRASCRERV